MRTAGIISLWAWLLTGGGALAAAGQNLVVNPGFEQYTYCRDTVSNVQFTAHGIGSFFANGLALLGTGAPGWLSPSLSTAGHILPCNIFPYIRGLGSLYSGWYRPKSGVGYLILRTYGVGPIVQPDESRTYAQGQLRQPLQAGCTYRISCWVRVVQKREGASFPTTAAVATDNLGAYFTTTRFGATTIAQLFSLQPQALLLPAGQLVTDTLNYTLLSRTFVAQGGEQYFTLGNFQTNAATLVRRIAPNPAPPLTAAYAIDDVSVEAVPPASLPLDLGPDRWLGACAGAAPATLTASPGFQGYRWRTGQTTRSIQVSQPGRYVVTADFGCGLVQDSVEVRRYDPRLTPLLGPPPALCPGQSVTLTALAGFESYQWADGPTGPSRTLSQPGRYRLTARTADGCLVRDSVELRLAPPLIPTGFPADTLVCAQQAWRYTLPPAPAGTTYLWSTGISGETLYVAPGAAGPYTLTVRTSCQTATATVRVRTQDCAALLRVPNVVTPNGDGQNDQFRILAPGPRTLRLQVFSRWGQLVFESADYRGQWPTGPQTAPGLYHYLLLDETYGRRYRGWVEVIR